MYPAQPPSSAQHWGPLLDTGRCPSCRAPITGSGPELRCSACGLPLGGPAAAKLAALLAEADRTLGQLRNQRPAPPARDWVPFAPQQPQQSPPDRRPGRPGRYSDYPLPPVQPLPSRQLPAAGGAVILLSLGGLCLVVAAIVFLSMSWTMLSLGGKVAVLAGVTALLGASATTATRQGLRGSAETLWAITLIDLALDVWAARRAGLAGLHSVSIEVFSTAGAALVAVTALACCLATERSKLDRPLISAQLAL
ncbi:MAG: hypothetical protein M3Y42_16650, partial [Actinomycetota bacterium]|nr:hypothetical protein [Actinomycetota bacterium]